MTATEIFGERIGMMRRRRGMTQPDLAFASGVALRTLARWESGEFSGADLNGVVRVAESLGVSVDYLLGRADNGAL